MISLLALIIPLLALWLWWPLGNLSRKTRIKAVLVTTVSGVMPAALLLMYQHGLMDYQIAAWLQVPGGWVLATLGMMLAFALIRDLCWLIAKLLRPSAWQKHLHQARLSLWALVLSSTLASWGLYNGLQAPQVHEQSITLDRLPAELDGLRLAIVADLHASPVKSTSYVQTVVDRVKASHPDLILLPGDLVDGDVARGAANVVPLAQLKAPYGVWVAPGNHEYYSGYDDWMAEFQRLGLGLLQNQSQRLTIKGHSVAISGIGDPVFGRTSRFNRDPETAEGVPPDVEAVAIEGAGADLHILLAHQPKFARDNAEHSGIDLQLSGHTHGGHVLGMDRWLVAPVNNGFVRGLYELGSMRLFVSNGAGLWAGFAVRLGVPPAIDLLVLRSPAKAS